MWVFRLEVTGNDLVSLIEKERKKERERTREQQNKVTQKNVVELLCL